MKVSVNKDDKQGLKTLTHLACSSSQGKIFKAFSLVPSLRGSLYCHQGKPPSVPFLMFSSQPSWIVWIREELPVPGQHLLPDDLPHDLRVDAEQLEDGGVRVVEAVQQNLRHLSLLLPYQPARIRKVVMQSMVQKSAPLKYSFRIRKSMVQRRY